MAGSRIFVGEVWHARTRPTPHAFRYPLYVYCFAVDELDSLEREVPLFGHNRLRPVSLYDRDYLARGEGPIRAKLDLLLQPAGVGPVASVDLVTSARYFDYVFNPASFFFCRRADGSIAAVVVQVRNTFGEMHAYVLTEPHPRSPGTSLRFAAPKCFHVSPFFGMDGEYEFAFDDPRERLDLRVEYRERGELSLTARLVGEARPFDSRNLARTLLAYPITASLTMPRILVQAAKLYYGKRLPLVPKPSPASAMTIRRAQPALLDRVARSAVFRFLDGITAGALEVEGPEGELRRCGSPDAANPAHLRVRNRRFFRRSLLRGEVGFGESFVDGDWESDDLVEVVRLLAANRDALDERSLLPSFLGRGADWLGQVLRRNTRSGARRNVARHYDLSNDFFRTFLDQSMTYSCALFRSPDESLEAAQQNKLDAIIERAAIGVDHHVLEIGCGWGSFALRAARRTGCRVTAITLSKAQLALARERVEAAGLADRVALELVDYRDLRGRFDRIVSIEMLEAVGHEQLPEFFAACDRLLAPGGSIVLQFITVADAHYERYRRAVDWIRKHIFPGGHLPSLGAVERALARASRLEVTSAADIGPHYATTLAEWRRRFAASRDRVLALGFDDSFVRKWTYYLSYCEAGFRAGVVGDLQVVLSRPAETGGRP